MITIGRGKPVFVFINAATFTPSRVRCSESPHQHLGMRGLLQQAGYTVHIIDPNAEELDVDSTVREALSFGPTAIGLTILSSRGNYGLFGQQLLSSLPPNVPVVGGGPTFYSPIYQKALLEQNRPPDFVVVNEGEAGMRALIAADFNRHTLLQSREPGVTIAEEGQSLVLTNVQRDALDTLSFLRPASWKRYKTISLDAQRGCPGVCVFCETKSRLPFYKSPDMVVAELEYIRQALGKNDYSFRGPDFPSDPQQATAIVKAIVKANLPKSHFLFYARVDTLSAALALEPATWGEFIARHDVNVIIGYESANPARLLRLGKYKPRDKSAALEHLSKLSWVFSNFPLLKATIDWILIDYGSELVEILFDLLVMRGLLLNFIHQLKLNNTLVFNPLLINPGARTRQSADYFDNLDPAIKSFLTQVHLKYGRISSWHFSGDEDYTQYVCEALLGAIQTILNINSAQGGDNCELLRQVDLIAKNIPTAECYIAIGKGLKRSRVS